MLVFWLARPGRLEITVFGPGPSCNQLGTFGRPGEPGLNQVVFTGRLYGRPLPAGWYAVVVEAVRGTAHHRIGRVFIQILARDGREGGNRPLAPPHCTAPGLASSGVAGRAFLAANAGGHGSPPSGGVAGAAESRGAHDGELGLPGLPTVPPLPPLPGVDPTSVIDVLTSPFVVFGVIGLLAAFAAASMVAYGVRRARESWY